VLEECNLPRSTFSRVRTASRRCKLSHVFPVGLWYDDPTSVSAVGLVQALGPAQRRGLHRLIAECVDLSGRVGYHPSQGVSCLVGG
jgi:hypothetical protein